MAQLSADVAQLAALQQQYQTDQVALADALSAKAVADAAYQQALEDNPGPGFIGFQGAYFDTLVLSGLGSLDGYPITTVIDTLETAPEPLTLSLFGTGLAGICALRCRKKKPA